MKQDEKNKVIEICTNISTYVLQRCRYSDKVVELVYTFTINKKIEKLWNEKMWVVTSVISVEILKPEVSCVLYGIIKKTY